MNRIKPLTGILFCLSVLNPTAGFGSNPASEHKIDSLLRLMTLEEKVSMCAGAAPRMAFQGVPRPSGTQHRRSGHGISFGDRLGCGMESRFGRKSRRSDGPRDPGHRPGRSAGARQQHPARSAVRPLLRILHRRPLPEQPHHGRRRERHPKRKGRCLSQTLRLQQPQKQPQLLYVPDQRPHPARNLPPGL